LINPWIVKSSYCPVVREVGEIVDWILVEISKERLEKGNL
jgi:hypothetical protein